MNEERVGMRFESTNGGPFEVVGREGYAYVIRFDHRGYEVVASWQSIEAGTIRNPFYPCYHGVGYIGSGRTQHPLLKRWWHMLARCYNPTHLSYCNYGARGIEVSHVLHNFANYVALLEALPGYNPSDLDTVDRIDNNKDYTPGNLKWSTAVQQRANQRPRKDQHDFTATSLDGTVYFGEVQAAFARKHGLRQGGISKCLLGHIKSHRGWTFEYTEVGV